MKKKITVALLGAMMAFSIVGCGGKKEGKEIKSNTITINDAKVDMNQLLDDWSKDDSPEHFNSVSEKLALDLAKSNVFISCSRTREMNIIDTGIYAKNDIVVPEDANTACFWYLTGDEYNICQVSSGGFYNKKAYDLVAPNGVSANDNMDELSSNPSCYQVLNYFAYGDIYSTQKDRMTGMGKGYVSIYLDGKLVDISSYEDTFKIELDKIGNDTQLQKDSPYREAYKRIPNFNFYSVVEYNRYKALPGDEVPGMENLIKHDIMAGLALEDCMEKIQSGANKELLVIRVQDNHNQMSDVENNTMFCVLITKK